jgi:hypothetical protein
VTKPGDKTRDKNPRLDVSVSIRNWWVNVETKTYPNDGGHTVVRHTPSGGYVLECSLLQMDTLEAE